MTVSAGEGATIIIYLQFLHNNPSSPESLFLCTSLHCFLLSFSLSLLSPCTCPHLCLSYPPHSAAMSASGSKTPNAVSGPSSALKKAFPHVDLHGNDLPPSPAPSSPHAGRRYAIATELVFTEGSDQYNASSMPIYQVRFNSDRDTV